MFLAYIKSKLFILQINFVAIWFSGHNITISGVYEDNSTFSDSIHVLNLLSQSPLFRDIKFSGKLHLGDKMYKTNLTVYCLVLSLYLFYYKSPSYAMKWTFFIIQDRMMCFRYIRDYYNIYHY